MKTISITKKSKKIVTVHEVVDTEFVIDITYRRIWKVAQAFNAHIPVGKGFGFLDSAVHKREVAVWCINLDDDAVWEDHLTDDGDTLLVRKAGVKSAIEFQDKIRKQPDVFHVAVKRLTFARTKKNGEYKFLGVFMLSAIDFDKQTLIFKRIAGNRFTLTKTKKQKVVISSDVETTAVVN